MIFKKKSSAIKAKLDYGETPSECHCLPTALDGMGSSCRKTRIPVTIHYGQLNYNKIIIIINYCYTIVTIMDIQYVTPVTPAPGHERNIMQTTFENH